MSNKPLPPSPITDGPAPSPRLQEDVTPLRSGDCDCVHLVLDSMWRPALMRADRLKP